MVNTAWMSTAGPYSNVLISGLRAIGWAAEVLCPWGDRTGLEKLADSDVLPGVVHLHWPEALLTEKEYRSANTRALANLRETLARLRRYHRLVITAHNLAPHEGYDAAFAKDLYGICRAAAHRVLHHTERSWRLAGATAADSVYRHPPYWSRWSRTISRQSARERYGLEQNLTWLLSLGNIHPYKRLDLLLDALLLLPANRFGLVIAGAVTHRTWFRKLESRFAALREAGHRLILIPGWLPEVQVNRLVAACDALILCHEQSTLSSGLPHLAEAQGTAVLALRSPYFVEVCADYAILLPRRGPRRLADCLSHVTSEALIKSARAAAAVGDSRPLDRIGRELVSLYELG